MAESPCNQVCVLAEDKNGTKRCASCLRTPAELNWNDLTPKQQKEIITRSPSDIFTD